MAEHPTTDPGDEETEAHDVAAHGDEDDHDDGHDDHGHESDSLGPVDTERWGAFALGIGLGLIVTLCIVLATGGSSA